MKRVEEDKGRGSEREIQISWQRQRYIKILSSGEREGERNKERWKLFRPVREKERERERGVYVCVRERERERAASRQREGGACVCVCVCVYERERERESL